MRSTICKVLGAAAWRRSQLLLGSVQPDLILYTTAINACEQHMQWPSAVTLLQACRDTLGIEDITATSVVATALGMDGQWQHAMHLFQGSGASLGDLTAQNIQLSACEKGKEWRTAMSAFHSFRLRRLTVTDRISSNALLSACGVREKWRQALNIFQSVMSSVQRSIVSYSALLNAFETASTWKKSQDVFVSLHQNHMKMNLICCNIAMSACERGDQWKAALLHLDSLDKAQLEGNVITEGSVLASGFEHRNGMAFSHAMFRNHAAEALEMGGMVLLEFLLRVLKQCSEPATASTRITSTNSALRRRFRFRHGSLRCLRLRGKAPGQGGARPALSTLRSRPDVVEQNSIISAQGRWSRWEDALQSFTQRRDATVVTYNALQSAARRGNQWTRALQILDQALASVKVDLLTWTSIIDLKEQRWHAALASLAEIRRSDLRLDSISQSAALTAMGSRWKKTWALYDEMSIKHLEQDLLCHLPLLQRWPQALELQILRKEAVDEHSKTVLLGATISSCAQGHRWIVSLQLLRSERLERLSVVAANAAIKACEKGDAWTWGLQLLQDFNVWHLVPDAISFNSASTSGAWRKSCELQQQMLQQGLRSNQFTESTLLHTLSTKAWRLAVNRFVETSKRSIRRNMVIYASSLKESTAWILALQSLQQLGQWMPGPLTTVTLTATTVTAAPWPRAVELLRWASGSKLEPDKAAWHSVSSWQQCLQLPRKLSQDSLMVTEETYSLAISACEDRHWRTALIFFRDAVSENTVDLDMTPGSPRSRPRCFLLTKEATHMLVGGDWNIWIIFPYIGNVILPTDELHYFQRGWLKPPTRYAGKSFQPTSIDSRKTRK
ncbi:unnamed protein product [Cladocopium goreaui]|uniref:Pentatricopeptide repeat-containing protein MRL1, chloroplastic (Protein MATURATION OF RBCL 1) (AtMRL1) n=1 Tax=Cladocopium goreaui TaxID=2562237 RepID=A0A9P1GEU8_9DINO|nr:unnamed protein product [Cladocopium goreaui]